MCQQEDPVPQPPEYADARDTAVASGLNVHGAVSHIDGTLFRYVQLAQGFHHRIRRGFLTNALALTNCHLYQVAEEMSTKLLCRRIELVAHHGNVPSLFP